MPLQSLAFGPMKVLRPTLAGCRAGVWMIETLSDVAVEVKP